MAKFICKKCKNKKELKKQTLIFLKKKVVVKEALCICGNSMKEILTEDHKGMPTIIRNEKNG